MTAQVEDHGLLRFLTCGSVDDGKSTLIGRLLFDSQAILADQLDTLERRAAGKPVDELAAAPGLPAQGLPGAGLPSASITVSKCACSAASSARIGVAADRGLPLASLSATEKDWVYMRVSCTRWDGVDAQYKKLTDRSVG